VEHYRPISICNTLYKLVTKILIRRLKGVLNDLISPEQGAFVPERSISDKILIAQEITHSLEDSHGADHYVLAKIKECAYECNGTSLIMSCFALVLTTPSMGV